MQPPPPPPPERLQPVGHEPTPDRPHWLSLDYLGRGVVHELGEEEREFWKFLINKYLYPLAEDKAQKAKVSAVLTSLVNMDGGEGRY